MELKDFIILFNEKYFVEKQMFKNNLDINKLSDRTLKVRDVFNDWYNEDMDEFMASFISFYNLDHKNYIQGLHFGYLADGFYMFFTIILKPIVGYKKWMIFSEDKRIDLTLENLEYAIEKGELNSFDLGESKALNP